MEFTTRVSGIPCVCNVIHYTPYRPMHITGSGYGDADPPEPAEFEFTLLDRKGYRATWLEAKLKPEDEQRLLEEFQLETLGQKYGYL